MCISIQYCAHSGLPSADNIFCEFSFLIFFKEHLSLGTLNILVSVQTVSVRLRRNPICDPSVYSVVMAVHIVVAFAVEYCIPGATQHSSLD